MAIKNPRDFADTLRNNKAEYESLWDDVSTLMGDGAFNRLNGDYETGRETAADDETYDPAIRRIRNTISDYYMGLLFPIKNPFSLLYPTETGLYKSWYDDVTNKILAYLQSSASGFYENAGVFFQDWTTYGNAALSVFETEDKDAPYFIKSYGIDCLSFSEGKNGMPNYFAYHDKYYASDLVETFGYNKVPSEVAAEYDNGSDKLFEVVLSLIPNTDFVKGASGKNGKQYVGYWYIGSDNQPIATEYYDEKPIAVARQIKTRGQIYGKSEISQNIGTLKTINASIFTAILNMKNTALPPMGVYSNSIMNGEEIDNTAGGLTVFDTNVMLNGATPIFPIMEQGDVSPLFNVLTTYLKDEIAKLNRMDLIVDIEQRTNMTATEFLRRLALKGDALGAILTRLLNQLEPFFERIVNISLRSGLIDLKNAPDEVKELVKSGKKWYKIGYNTAVNSLLDGAKQSDLLNSINLIGATAGFDPSIAQDLDFYSVLKEQFGNGMLGSALTVSTSQHMENKKAVAAQQQQLAQSQVDMNLAKANKDMAQSSNAYERQV